MAAQPRRKVTWRTVKKDEIKLSAVVEEYLQYEQEEKKDKPSLTRMILFGRK